ncbi:MAG: HlyD family type I secretion periplasmic adaptor subunit [Sphingomonadales bacterium]|nr:HlyD family type I secretion periplasmic adaptor subunit [Sphingomonadales bacterium]MBK9003011.1 HlyD family type I secretion periplasmic adaptor subunit [Sphingomonadales bacterium]MBK9268259.1 HlyD family type I secretion periplasmic adaptor subunit [Sphingomonadales bacterium]MBP6434079.1 HlyD family type I secretion periplasmic adaptor subunit [Sphingorhabdus sp.]
MNAPLRIPVGGFAPFDTADQGQGTAAPRVRGPLRFAFIALAAFAVIFAIWAWVAPLNSAAIASGILEAAGGGRRTVQHLEGGIVSRFLVKEGQPVRAGDVLVELDTTQTEARDDAVRSALYGLLAQDARLTAERQGLPAIRYPAELLALAEQPEVQSIIAASNALFSARRRSLADQSLVLSQRLGQARAEIRSSRAQLSSLGDQQRLLDDEEMAVGMLVDEGLERKSRLLTLQRQRAAAQGQHGQITNNVDRLHKTIDETQAQMTFLRGQMATEAATQQRDIQMQIAEAREKLKVSEDVRKRAQIVAPVDGKVANLRLITPGGVIGQGQPVLDIVPSNEKIVVAARLRAEDIDAVRPGLSAEVRLTPYKARVLRGMNGVVRDVSPDASYDEAVGMLYYKVKVEIDPAELKSLPQVELVSGMPAEVFIDLGANSLLQYLFQPMIDSFNRAFREQ